MLSNTTKLKGLYTYGNELIQPEGSLVVADNVNIDEPNVITPRRGFEDFGQDEFSSDRVKQMMSYKKHPLRHIEDRVEFFRDNQFVPFSGSFHQVDQDIRIKFAEANANFYFTTSSGIKKISAKSPSDFTQEAGYITDAGIPKALGCSGKVHYSNSGFLPPQSKVAYKVLFGKKDINNNLILGTPSSRFVAINSSRDTYNYERTFLEFKQDEDFKAERTTITCSNGDQTLQTLTSNNSILLVNSAKNAHKYAFWFNKGSGIAPSLPDTISVEVDLSGVGLTSADVANRLYTAATDAGLEDILVTLSGSDVIFTNSKPGFTNGVNSPDSDVETDIGSGWNRLVNVQGTDSKYIQKYFIVHTQFDSFCFYYGNSETIQNPPNDPSIIGMTLIGIQINNNSTKSFIGNVTSQSLQTNLQSYFNVELNNSGLNPIVTLTDIVGGNIPDATQGTVSNTDMEISVVNQGSINEGKNASVKVTFFVPYGVDETHFFQIYRTPFVTVTEGLTLNDIDPGESAYLVYEAPVSGQEGTEITVEDVSPDTFRASGTPLYNNPGLSSDILQTNDRPPVAKDICNYQTFTFYANTSVYHRLTMDLIGMDSFISESSQFVISNKDTSVRYTFRGTPKITTIECGDKQNTLIHNDSNPDAKIYLYSALDETVYVAYFDDGTASTPSDVDAIPLRVNISDLNPSDNVAERFALILAQISDFIISDISLNSFNITNAENGVASDVDTLNSDPSTDLGTGWSFTKIEDGTGEDSDDGYVLLSGSPSVSLRIERTARSLVDVINNDVNSPVNASYLSGLNDLPGKLFFEARNIEEGEFYCAVKDIDSEAFNPNLPVIPNDSFTSISSVGTRTQLEIVDHEFEDGEEVFINLPDTTPVINGKFTVEVVDDDNIIIDTPYGSGTVNDSFFFYPFQVSDNLAIKNRLMWSKSGQPEAVPMVNYVDIGTRDEPIERILALRDYLFILKQDGIYMLSGYSAPFTVRQLDTERISCPDSAVVLNNQIYMLSTNSVIVINEASPSIISRMIEDKLFEVLNQGFPYRNLGFGVSYSDDRAYLLWLPSTVNDTVATQCFRYNILERTWTRWTKSATCGHVIGTYPKLYIGDGDRSITLTERKNRDRTDYADKDFIIEMSVLDTYINGKYKVSDSSEIEVGDVITQTQYLNIDEYNRLLLKLDLDEGLGEGYYESFSCNTADNIASKLTSLNLHLIEKDDSGTITNHSFTNNDWVLLQHNYNELIDELNNPATLTTFKDYSKSTGSVTYEYIISEVDRMTNEIKTPYETSMILGTMTVYKHIKSVVQTSPIHFGNPSSWKQVTKGYLLFDQNNFYRMKLEYSSDLSAYFEGHEFKGRGAGFWDYGQWGFQDRNYWGGDGNDAPRRVIIPRNKQRCRYITVRFSHSTARDFYKVNGVAHDVREVSTRAYK